MDCRERKDHILLYAAGVLDADEQQEIRAHLAGGCPQCAGVLAEAEAVIANLSLAVEPHAAPPAAKDRLMQRVRESQAQANQPASYKINEPSRSPFAPAPPSNRMPWDRVIIPSSIAAILAVAVTLGMVSWLRPNQPQVAKTDPQIGMLTELLKHDEDVIHQLQAATRPTAGLNFVEMTGGDQPQALGRVFIDTDDKKWYFFTSGMKPAPTGKTYELWLIAAGQKLPAGTFQVNADGSATLLGNVPPLPAGQPVTLAVTDEPAGGVAIPTGQIQILGTVQ